MGGARLREVRPQGGFNYNSYEPVVILMYKAQTIVSHWTFDPMDKIFVSLNLEL